MVYKVFYRNLVLLVPLYLININVITMRNAIKMFENNSNRQYLKITFML